MLSDLYHLLFMCITTVTIEDAVTIFLCIKKIEPQTPRALCLSSLLFTALYVFSVY